MDGWTEAETTGRVGFCGEGLSDVGMKWRFKNCDPSWGGGEVRARGSFKETGRVTEALKCFFFFKYFALS